MKNIIITLLGTFLYVGCSTDAGKPNNFSFIDGSLTITDMDTVAGVVNGNYHGTAKNLRGEKLQISDGHIISASLKAGIISY